jgi:hypothetical protein
MKDYPQSEIDFDVADPGILCNADKEGAKIFFVPPMGSLDDEIRVLAFDKKTAFSIGTKYSTEKSIVRYLESAWHEMEEADTP